MERWTDYIHDVMNERSSLRRLAGSEKEDVCTLNRSRSRLARDAPTLKRPQLDLRQVPWTRLRSAVTLFISPSTA
jgi:hypothetical protein